MVLVPITIYGQSSFVDARDNNEYQMVELGGLFWMTEDLRFNAEGSLCVENCDGSRFYSFEGIKAVCPEGWRLPMVDEWDSFVESFENVAIARMMEGNDKLYRVDFLDQYNLFDSNVLSLKPLGRIEGGKFKEGVYVDYWTENPLTDDRFHMHFTPYSIMGHAHKHHLKPKQQEDFRLFPVRCVCESEKIKSE